MRRAQALRNESYSLLETSVNNTENNSIRSHILSSASLQKALGNPSPGTNKKKESKRRNSRKSDSSTVIKNDQPTSQWYTVPTEISQINMTLSTTSLLPSFPSTPIFELRQELTPKRPLRSEVEKERRISNRWSGQSHYLRNTHNGSEISVFGRENNRDSVGTTDSTASEEDAPPPLPVKTREADYCNLPEEFNDQRILTTMENSNNTNRSFGQWIKNKLPTPTDDDIESQSKPPTPPPKPKRPTHGLFKNSLISSSGIENYDQDSSPA